MYLAIALSSETTPAPPALPPPILPPPIPLPPLVPGACLPVSLPGCVHLHPELISLRQASFSCLATFAAHNPDFGTKDSGWAEYSPRCVTINGEADGSLSEHTFIAAEPLNSISSLKYDDLSCHSADLPGAAFAAEVASLLGFGSFAMHASGGHSLTTKFDVVPMNCLIATLVYLLFNRTNTPPLVTVGTSAYAFDAIASRCKAEITPAVRSCELEPDLHTQVHMHIDMRMQVHAHRCARAISDLTSVEAPSSPSSTSSTASYPCSLSPSVFLSLGYSTPAMERSQPISYSARL